MNLGGRCCNLKTAFREYKDKKEEKMLWTVLGIILYLGIGLVLTLRILGGALIRGERKLGGRTYAREALLLIFGWIGIVIYCFMKKEDKLNLGGE